MSSKLSWSGDHHGCTTNKPKHPPGRGIFFFEIKNHTHPCPLLSVHKSLILCRVPCCSYCDLWWIGWLLLAVGRLLLVLIILHLSCVIIVKQKKKSTANARYVRERIALQAVWRLIIPIKRGCMMMMEMVIVMVIEIVNVIIQQHVGIFVFRGERSASSRPATTWGARRKNPSTHRGGEFFFFGN
jgi:hypothetical protein